MTTLKEEQALANSPQKMALCPRRDCRSALIAWNEIPFRCILCGSPVVPNYPPTHKRDLVISLVEVMRTAYGETAVMIFAHVEERIAWEEQLKADLSDLGGWVVRDATALAVANNRVAQAMKTAIDSGIAKVE